MSKNHLEILIIKFLDGDISEKETAQLKTSLLRPEHQKIFEAFVNQHFELQLLLQDIDIAKDYGKVLDAINKKRMARKKKANARALVYAAIFIGLLSSSLALYYGNFFKKEAIDSRNLITLQLQDGSVKVLDQGVSRSIANTKGKKVVTQQQNLLLYADSVPSATANEEELAFNELTVPYGKKFQIKLSDGTHVYLNSGSKIKYPVRFLNNSKREVFLDGEAYFEVKKNDRAPFVVNTEELNTVVLGTKFNVSSYKNEFNTSTVLVEGAVRVEGGGKATEIEPGERAVIEDGSISVDAVNVEKHIAWTKGKLFFVDDSFELILKELERHFNVRIENDDQDLGKIPFTGTFETESLNAILTTFQLHSDFNFSLSENGKSIWITKTYQP